MQFRRRDKRRIYIYRGDEQRVHVYTPTRETAAFPAAMPIFDRHASVLVSQGDDCCFFLLLLRILMVCRSSLKTDV